MRKARAGSSRTRVRSFGGCLTCRARKVKCDEIHPRCGQCSRAGLVCGGYEAKIRFVHYIRYPDGSVPSDDISLNDGRTRRILFTERERAAMSRQMRHLVNEDELERLLNELDSDNDLQTCGQLLIGPFGLFRTNDTGSSKTTVPSLEIPAPTSSPDIRNVSDALVINTPDVCPWLEPVSGASELLTSIEGMLADVDREADLSQDLSTFCVLPSLSPVNGSGSASPSLLDFHLGHDIENDLEVPVSTNARFLLEHYKSQMGKLFSPLRVRKPPWSILHFPRALSAFSELTIFKTTTHAKTSLFYSILAVSAFNLDKINLEQKDSSTYWWAVGERFRHRAKKELEWSCETELDGEKRSKYKDILMAILTMVTISVVTGQQEEARSFLLNAEIFICFRGVPKVNKSRKVKLLHHIYLFLRVIEESTYIYPPETAPLLNSSLPHEKMLFPSLRTHSLRVGRDLDGCCGGDFELGLLGELGDEGSVQTSTLFGQIYGFPQELLSFISRTTCLANDIMVLKNSDQKFSMTAELEDRSKKLENDICFWSSCRDGVADSADDPISMSANRAIMPHLIVAIHCAAIIFFYRRVRELNPLLLQSYVEKTIVNLEEFEQEKLNLSLVNCGIVWPGFIAAAEALEPDLQARSYKLLRHSAKISGMRNFDVAADFVQDLWRIRREDRNLNISWMDLVINRQLALVLT